MVKLSIKFSSRRPGSFGNSSVGRVMEWLTTTWLRFTCSLFSGLIIVLVLFSNIPAGEKIPLILGAPFVAIVYWYMFLFLLLISEYLGKYGVILSRVLIIYYYLFSRLVVHEPPIVGLGLTHR
jgi:hypothetical protein